MYHALILFVLSLMASCSWIPGASESPHIGMIVALQGEPNVVREGISYSVVPNVALEVGDVVLTGPGEIITLRMRDKTLITLNEGTELAFHVYSMVEPSPLARLSLGHGALKVTPGKFVKRDQARFEIATPIADLRIEAGEIWAMYDGQLTVTLLAEGRASLVNVYGSSTISRAGESVRARIGEAPGVPGVFQDSKLVAAPLHLNLED